MIHADWSRCASGSRGRAIRRLLGRWVTGVSLGKKLSFEWKSGMRKGYLPPSMKASLGAEKLNPPYWFQRVVFTTGGRALYLPGGNAQVHHC
jgi:hypothetical protein